MDNRCVLPQDSLAHDGISQLTNAFHLFPTDASFQDVLPASYHTRLEWIGYILERDLRNQIWAREREEREIAHARSWVKIAAERAARHALWRQERLIRGVTSDMEKARHRQMMEEVKAIGAELGERPGPRMTTEQWDEAMKEPNEAMKAREETALAQQMSWTVGGDEELENRAEDWVVDMAEDTVEEHAEDDVELSVEESAFLERNPPVWRGGVGIRMLIMRGINGGASRWILPDLLHRDG